MAQNGGVCTNMGNQDRNSYVRHAIADATVRLLEERPLDQISVSQIVTAAQVSRNSFYRNYASKEDILLDRAKELLAAWGSAWEEGGDGDNAHMYASLFAHLKEHAGFYQLLERRGLFHLVLDALLDKTGPKPELDDLWAYTTAFITYGTYGWVKEWLHRGMPESADQMAALLAAHSPAHTS